MVSSPNTEGLYGAQGGAGIGPIGAVTQGRDTRDTGAEANATYSAYQTEQKRLADEAAAAAAAAKASAPTSDEAYAQSLEAWSKQRGDWTGGQTHFSNPYGIPAMQIAAIQKAGAAPAAQTAIQRQMLANLMGSLKTPNFSSYQGYAGNSSGGGGHLR